MDKNLKNKPYDYIAKVVNEEWNKEENKNWESYNELSKKLGLDANTIRDVLGYSDYYSFMIDNDK